MENEDGEAMENSWPWHGVEDTSDYSDLSDLANSEKRGSKIKIFGRKKLSSLTDLWLKLWEWEELNTPGNFRNKYVATTKSHS